MQVLPYLLLAILTILSSVAPAVLYSLVVWWLDRYEKEPWGLLAATFVWGAIPAIVLSLMAECVLVIPFVGLFGEVSAQLISGSIVAPIVEETAKAVAIAMVFIVFRREIDGVLDGIVYGALVGFGFAMTENALYFLGALMEGGVGNWLIVVFTRTMVFGLNHGLFSGILVHAVHNLSVSLAAEMCWPILVSFANDWGGVIVLLIMVLLSWDREKGWITEELSDEVSAGTLSQDDYETAVLYGRRVAAQWRALYSYGLVEARRVRRYFQVATDLAFAKRRLRDAPGDKAGERMVSRLRAEIRVLKEQIAEQ
jgi:RsiW-degrading membrane proteinase PrsW (M82 family)